MGVTIACFGAVGLLQALSMFSPSEGAVLFWQKAAWSAILLCPVSVVWGLVHYRGFKKFLASKGINDIATGAETGVMIFFLGTGLALIGLVWFAPEAFFRNVVYADYGFVTILQTNLSFGHQFYEVYFAIAFAFMMGISVRFFALEETFPIAILMLTLISMPVGLALAVPINIDNLAHPIPNMAALSFPLLGLYLHFLYVYGKPPIHLHYAAAMHPTAWHDLRNLTAAVQSRMTLLREQTDLNERILNEIAQIEVAMGELSGYMRQVSLPTPTKESQVQKDEVLVTGVVKTTCDFWEKIAFRKNINGQTKLYDAPLILTVDPTWLKRCLDNLLQNAIKFTPPNGTINICTRTDDERFHIEVSDTGIGINEPNQQQVFEAYYRGANTQGLEGDGLGLSSVADFATYHHATIKLSSALGKDTKIILSLPLD